MGKLPDEGAGELNLGVLKIFLSFNPGNKMDQAGGEDFLPLLFTTPIDTG
jgi:hypothetical protein